MSIIKKFISKSLQIDHVAVIFYGIQATKREMKVKKSLSHICRANGAHDLYDVDKQLLLQ